MTTTDIIARIARAAEAVLAAEPDSEADASARWELFSAMEDKRADEARAQRKANEAARARGAQ